MAIQLPQKITVPSIQDRKGSPDKISALTAYDYTMAKLIDSAGVDIILVGDSLGSVIQGHPNTIPVTIDEMVYHCKCVSRGVEHALVVGDMPFMSYQVSTEKAVESAGRFFKEGNVAAVKLEGGINVAKTVEKIVSYDMPVMGHIGLTPQSFHRMGGHKLQGRTHGHKAGSRERLIEDAKAIEDAGAFSLVIEGVPADLAAEITGMISIPTIGIGAGAGCDGQILVSYDMLGMIPDWKPKFVKHYATLSEVINSAVKNYIAEVHEGEFPAPEHAASITKADRKLKSIKFR